MPRVPQSKNNTTPVQKFDDTAYDAVVIVADNIEDVILAAGGVDVMALYLGASDTEPTEGKDGADLISGNFYLDTTSSSLKYWDAENTVWVESDVDTVVSAAQDAQAARDAAQAAQTAAELAESNASNSATNAATSASASSNSASEAATHASNASVSEGNAATSANNAANSATAALDSENAASVSAGESAASATASDNSAIASAASESNAAASAVSAANSASQAEVAFDNFDDMYLGRKTVEPTVDNDGNPIQVGASYWHDNGDNTGEQRFWNGASWESPELTATQAAQTAVTARDDAQISETNAANSANAAGTSANDADNSATAASNSAAAALASQNAAEGFKDQAETAQGIAQSAANAAGVSESNAATSETNAAASEAAAELAASTVTWKVHTRGQAELDAMREAHKDARAASGFDHYGKHVKYASGNNFPVNEGMWTTEGLANALYMGRTDSNAILGESKTNFPVTQIAGFVSELFNCNTDNVDNRNVVIKFPEAPNGTVIYDNTGDARGSGLFTLDLTVDVDPKYGDVAADTNEAVARAFEGECQNGDFRVGTGFWDSENGGTITVTNGIATISGAGNAYGGVRQTMPRLQGTDSYYVEIALGSITSAGNVVFRDGVGGQVVIPLDANSQNKVMRSALLDMSAAVSAPYLLIEATSDGNLSVEVSSVRVVKATEEVVTERVDMFGGEFFLEEVTQANPFVYPKGMIQSQATTMNGITTVASARPATYYAVFTGDTTSRGLGVDFWAATDQEKIDMVSDHSNNIFMLADGRVVQFRMRQRTIAGAGNGDWFNTNPTTSSAALYFSQEISDYVAAQGIKDEGVGFIGDNSRGDAIFYSNTHNSGWSDELGVFKAGLGGGADETTAVDGECYFHVWGTAERLNQGAFHPSSNPMGTATWRQDGVGYAKWYEQITGFTGYNSTAMCFEYANGVTGVYGGQIGASANGTGRDDGRFYDAIYAGGQGGVTDLRLSAWDMGSKEEAAKVFQKVVNGTYRGKEALPFTTIHVSAVNDWTYVAGRDYVVASSGAWLDIVPATNTSIYPRNAAIVDSAGNVAGDVYRVVDNGINTYVYFVGEIPTALVNGGMTVVWTEDTDYSVSGEFTMMDILGDPVDILATPDLANGWLGGYMGNHDQDGTTDAYPLTRKSLNTDSTMQYTLTEDFGTTWQTGTTLFNSTTNSVAYTSTPHRVMVNVYPAFAKQTKESTNKKVLNGQQGLGDVFATCDFTTHQGGLFSESLIGKVLTSVGTNKPYNTLTRLDVHIDPNVGNLPTWYSHTHSPVEMASPNNDSPAVKALWYQTSENGQVGLNFAYNELVYTSEGTTFETFDSSTNTAFTQGKMYHCTAGRLAGNVFHCFNSGSSTITAYAITHDGMLTPNGVDTHALIRPYSKEMRWGDDSTVCITDGQSTYQNLNGDTCLYGSNELALPMGYTKNHARVGTQVEGVDL